MQKYITGDLVKYQDRVYEIIETINTSYVEFENITETIPVYDIKPIPLTPEILEKNGWKKDGKWYYLKTRRAYLYTIQDAGQPDEFLICANTDKHNLTSVSFVHQLQHLLFGLGLNSEMEV